MGGEVQGRSEACDCVHACARARVRAFVRACSCVLVRLRACAFACACACVRACACSYWKDHPEERPLRHHVTPA